MTTIAWTNGGTAVLEVLDDDRVELVSTRAFAPGSRPEGVLSRGGQRIWLKVHGARRQEDGTFRIKGRLLNVTREVRGLLSDLLKEVEGGPNGGKSSTS